MTSELALKQLETRSLARRQTYLLYFNHMKRPAYSKIGISILAIAFTTVGGCAKAPAGSVANVGSMLLISFKVAGRVRPDYFYFVLFNTAPNSPHGPIPVTSAPWGNGFAAGEFDHFVRYDQSQPNGGYGIYSVVPGSQLRTFTYLGSPTQFTPVDTNSNTLSFQIPLAELATSGVPAGSINQVQINFIATDRIPVDPNDPNTKLFDALGDARQPGGVNDPITIPTTQSAVFQNSSSITPEPSGDVTETGNGHFVTVTEPDLDIVDWRVEVRD